MAANTQPIFVRIPDNSTNNATALAATITAAANDFTGSGANNVLVFTADTSNGSFIQRLRIKGLGTNVATVLRIFLNNGSTNATATNNVFIGEIPLAASTASATTLTSLDIDYMLNMPMSPGFRIYVGLATAVAAGIHVVAVAGDY